MYYIFLDWLYYLSKYSNRAMMTEEKTSWADDFERAVLQSDLDFMTMRRGEKQCKLIFSKSVPI